MLKFGEKKIRALRDKINEYSNSRVVRKKNSERNKKPYPHCKLNGRHLSDLSDYITNLFISNNAF